MKRALPYILLAIGLLIVLRALVPPRYDSDFDVASFAELPVQAGGRILPLDSVAMNTLRVISQKSVVRTEDGKLPAIEWLMMVCFKPEAAAELPIFRIDNDEVLGLLGMKQEDKKYFSYAELLEHRQVIGEQASQANPEAQLRSVFERQVIKLATAMNQYERLSWSLHAGGEIAQLPLLYQRWVEVAIPGREAFGQRERGEPFDETAFQIFAAFTNEFLQLSQLSELGVVPPFTPELRAEKDWGNVGEGLLTTITTGKLDPVVAGYAELAVAYQMGDAEAFNKALAHLHAEFNPEAPMGRIAFEEFFNNFAPFYQAILLYVLIFFIVAVSWLKWPEELQRGAFWLLILAFVVHTFALGARMWIQGRPPITNLYSSAIFVGWGALLLAIVLEKIFKGGIGSFVASIIGFVTLVIAHNLAKTGDTLEMMRAVLDSNFWLTTHVIIITFGYSAVFLAGTLAAYYLIRGTLTTDLGKSTRTALYRMVYGITCFSLLFSFVGTMLGGIWADQSWGRFWGWDPKENGALLIVLWCALMLHARWGGVVRERGFMVLAIGGNIITAWSWFGTNLLGVGLHSYGFTDSGFLWLLFFWFTQLCIIILGLIPQKHWRSNQANAVTTPSVTDHEKDPRPQHP